MALLNISETEKIETVIIDEKEYNLASFDDFSPADGFRLKKTAARIAVLAEKDDPSDKDIAEVKALTDEMFLEVAGDIPEETRKKLKPGARQRIVTAFFLAFAKEIAPKSTELRSPSGQEKQSPGSSDSTEGAPSTG